MSVSLASSISVSVLVFAVVGCRSTPATAETWPVPVYEEAFHHLVYQNAFVRVLDVQLPAGDTSQYHVHADPLVGVSVQAARSWEQLLGAPPGSIEAPGPVPAVGGDWDRARPYTHRVGNADMVSFHNIVGEWLSSPGLECPALADTDSRDLAKETQIVRIYEVRLAAHATEEAHVHACPGLTVLGTPGTLSDEGTSPVAAGGTGAGRWEWRNAGHRHVLRNSGGTPLIVYEINWR